MLFSYQLTLCCRVLFFYRESFCILPLFCASVKNFFLFIFKRNIHVIHLKAFLFLKQLLYFTTTLKSCQGFFSFCLIFLSNKVPQRCSLYILSRHILSVKQKFQIIPIIYLIQKTYSFSLNPTCPSDSQSLCLRIIKKPPRKYRHQLRCRIRSDSFSFCIHNLHA